MPFDYMVAPSARSASCLSGLGIALLPLACAELIAYFGRGVCLLAEKSDRMNGHNLIDALFHRVRFQQPPGAPMVP